MKRARLIVGLGVITLVVGSACASAPNDEEDEVRLGSVSSALLTTYQGESMVYNGTEGVTGECPHVSFADAPLLLAERLGHAEPLVQRHGRDDHRSRARRELTSHHGSARQHRHRQRHRDRRGVRKL